MSITTAILALAGSAVVSFALGWAFGWGKGREHYAALVGEQEARLVAYAGEVEQLEARIDALVAPPPSADAVDRVFAEVDSGPDEAA